MPGMLGIAGLLGSSERSMPGNAGAIRAMPPEMPAFLQIHRGLPTTARCNRIQLKIMQVVGNPSPPWAGIQILSNDLDSRARTSWKTHQYRRVFQSVKKNLQWVRLFQSMSCNNSGVFDPVFMIIYLKPRDGESNWTLELDIEWMKLLPIGESLYWKLSIARCWAAFQVFSSCHFKCWNNLMRCR